jgi:hypothetical protein
MPDLRDDAKVVTQEEASEFVARLRTLPTSKKLALLPH